MNTNSLVPENGAESAQLGSFNASALSASLTVNDLRASMSWYRDVLGFVVENEYEFDGVLRAVRLRAGTVLVLINQDDGARGFDRVKGEGFSLQFTTTQDIDDIANRIKGSGGSLDTEPADMPWGARMFRLKDPDGFKLVISSERDSSGD